MTFTVYGADGRRIQRGVAETYARQLAGRIHDETGEDVQVVADDATPTAPTAAAPVDLGDLASRTRSEIDAYAASELGLDTRAAKTKKHVVALIEAKIAEAPVGMPVLEPAEAEFFALWDATSPDDLIDKIAGWAIIEEAPSSADVAVIAAHEEASGNRQDVLDALRAYTGTIHG